jgi:geranylgeranyl diphosphate synthase, type II
VLKKTAWYSFIHPMRIGALVANGDDRKLDRFDRFGFLLGAAFQITDDVLNLTGDARYGKKINGDLLEGKRTIVLAHALGKVNATDRAWIGKLSEPSPRAPIDPRSPAAPTDPGEHRQYRVGSAIGCRVR